ncbi:MULTISPECIES: ABC transporter substrate-binding protein [Maritimibacter]|jgi:branched-chain amino acid transport system substrate-binding protein|uniref:ABC branched amino acid transporter family, periplasmic substrate-binding protein n=1 Tax=Maritimibacter alkaliphilus HTCC2654 TaxID=314271 RepID=A3VKC0_9RHOB|nr:MULTISPECIES: ABC transporter substrate-binding protein [Maritimibacter]EAQ11244.1 ABC branched amino acid transporter family, periplasmic substrate-binding protein [Maritimibacter alkaliphilus HTCC2654]MBL6429495.1 ABC transporter substrate-binding protein [Maritimibacter sp.]TYP81463.1 amino acid/amide ABC transporter substrate-binding protein (HAAT family) [Maritimibacter alkaliphilus HTCC2654]
MKKLLLASSACALVATGAFAESHMSEAKIGILLGFTGPIESLTPHMAQSAELALKEVNDSGMFLEGVTLTSVQADTTCVDASAATAAGEGLVSNEGVIAIMGAACSGSTTAVLANVALPNGIPMISPSSTSPALTTVEDNGLFFRTAPSDARQGEVLAQVLSDKGVTSVAVTYTNNDYGKGFADAFSAAFEGMGGSITTTVPHEDGKGDYSAEVASLASAGGDVLVVLGYADSGGKGVIQSAIDTGAFETFAMGDGMYADSLIADLGDMLVGSYGTIPGAEGEGAEAFVSITDAAGINGSSAFTRESYDAAALLALAAFKGGAATGEAIAANVMDVANAPGEPILPGELGKALEILANGGEIDYVGASGVELIEPGEAAGTYEEYEITDDGYSTVQFR